MVVFFFTSPGLPSWSQPWPSDKSRRRPGQFCGVHNCLVGFGLIFFVCFGSGWGPIEDERLQTWTVWQKGPGTAFHVSKLFRLRTTEHNQQPTVKIIPRVLEEIFKAGEVNWLRASLGLAADEQLSSEGYCLGKRYSSLSWIIIGGKFTWSNNNTGQIE